MDRWLYISVLQLLRDLFCHSKIIYLAVRHGARLQGLVSNSSVTILIHGDSMHPLIPDSIRPSLSVGYIEIGRNRLPSKQKCRERTATTLSGTDSRRVHERFLCQALLHSKAPHGSLLKVTSSQMLASRNGGDLTNSWSGLIG